MTIPPLKTEWRSYASKWAKVCRWFAAGRTFTDWATSELLAAARIRLSGDRADRQGTEVVPGPDGP